MIKLTNQSNSTQDTARLVASSVVRIVVRDGEIVDEALKRHTREANEQQGRNL